MKKNYTVALLGVLSFAMLGSVFGLASSKGLVTLSAEPNQNYQLTLTKANNSMKDKNGNPINGSASTTPQEFVLNSNTTIKSFYATYNGDMFMRLNNHTSSSPSYFEKEEACNGMTSIHIDLNYGYVDILTGYLPGSFTNRYTVKPSSSGANVQLQKTINVEGNYFRVENTNSSTNALIKSITINYGCTAESAAVAPVAPSYTMQKGSNQDAVRANPGHWFYHWNDGWRVSESPKPEFSNNSFTSQITDVDSNSTKGVWYRYQPETIDGLSNRYSVRLEVRLSVAGKVAGVDGDNVKDVSANTWTSYVSPERTFDSDTQPFYLRINNISELPEEGYVTVEVRNISIARVVD